jgi:hypothetical protein
MLYNNNYPQNTIQHTQNSTNKNNEQKQKRKLAAFTFFRQETRSITKLLKNTEIGISYRTKNNIHYE